MSILVAFTLGLFSSVHCAGMCGGIVSALALGLPQEVRSRSRRLAGFVLAYNIGRVASYTVAGALAGLLMGGLTRLLPPAHGILAAMAAAVLVLVGLHLAGWFPQLLRIESLGAGLWRRLQVLGRRLLPVRSLARAFVFGMMWGWLPCGLVYSALVWASASGDPRLGAGYMALFGLGTLPAVAGLGMAAGAGLAVLQQPRVRRLVGVALICVGIASAAVGTQHAGHDHGAHHEYSHPQ